jgi:hypothetical protein
MRRSISNPRIVLAVLAATILVWLVAWAYLAYPRVGPGFGGIGGTIHVWEGNNAEASHAARLCDALEKRLASPQFLSQLIAADPRHPSIFPQSTPVFIDGASDLSVKSLASTITNVFTNDTIMFIAYVGHPHPMYSHSPPNVDALTVSISYMVPRAYQVLKPSNSWVLWFQSWLPGMPDADKLTTEADAANRAAKDCIEKQIRLAAQDTTPLSDGKK